MQVTKRIVSSTSNASPTVARPITSMKKKRIWPLWMKLAMGSIIFYVFLIIYFVASLEKNSFRKGELHQQTAVSPKMKAPMDKTQSIGRPGIKIPPVENVKETTHYISEDASSQSYSHTTTSYGFNRDAAEAHLKSNGPKTFRKIIGAYLEPPMNYTVPGTINQGDVTVDSDPGMPPEFITPIPLRTFRPSDLKYYAYPKFQTCHDLPAKLPVDRGLELDKQGKAVVWNIGNYETPDTYPWDEAPHCPVDADPFLPWIHDMFPSHDATVMEFIAHNRRRCKTGKKHRKDVLRLEPQVALMQHVSVERLSQSKATALAPELWDSTDELEPTAHRYRLAPMNESASDGQFTRFICRFYGTILSENGLAQSVLVEENLSVYPYNYEFISYRKAKPTMITPKGKDNQFFWTSVLRFQCPIPKSLQKVIKSGETILSDGTPTLHMDLIPIRTPPRFGTGEIYLTEDMIGPRKKWVSENFKGWRGGKDGPVEGFDAATRWGSKGVLPRVEASGRWTNLPICQPPTLPKDKAGDERKKIEYPREEADKGTDKPHLLSACVWASTSFKTRGKGSGSVIEDTEARMREWIEFHLMVGFDHIYFFDNSGAQTNKTSLAPVLDEYPKSQITRIEWPSIICNNNIPAHDSTGERSSQYTAENACRTRFAQNTEWIAAFDTDEYMIPAGDYTDLRSVLRDAKRDGTNILTFRSSRARLMYERSRDSGGGYRVMMPNQTFLEAYNCDSSPIPKPEWAERARKQIYRADFVPYHYVHYSTVTQGYMQWAKDNPGWKRVYRESSERVSNDLTQATMMHTKTTTPDMTARWQKRCHYQFEKKWRGCMVGFAWPNGVEDPTNSHNEEGMEYNCFHNSYVDTYWIPKLKEALAKRRKLLLTSKIE